MKMKKYYYVWYKKYVRRFTFFLSHCEGKPECQSYQVVRELKENNLKSKERMKENLRNRQRTI